MTEGEQFEKWAAGEGWCNFTRINEGYAVDHLDDAYQAWQASRRAALEEIAAWIEPQRNDVAAHGFEFAAAIRALAAGDKQS
jgi:hypothetical protein